MTTLLKKRIYVDHVPLFTKHVKTVLRVTTLQANGMLRTFGIIAGLREQLPTTAGADEWEQEIYLFGYREPTFVTFFLQLSLKRW